jgi:hypothetical protein
MSDLYLLARNRRILVHLHSSIDHFHSFTMQSLAYQRHLLTADPASHALLCSNTALAEK